MRQLSFAESVTVGRGQGVSLDASTGLISGTPAGESWAKWPGFVAAPQVACLRPMRLEGASLREVKIEVVIRC